MQRLTDIPDPEDKTGREGVARTVLNTVTLNSLTYNIASSSTNNGYLASFAFGGIINLAEDFNLNVVMNPYASGEVAPTIRMYGSNQFNIGGDFNIDYNRNKSGGYIGINIMNDPSVSAAGSVVRARRCSLVPPRVAL